MPNTTINERLDALRRECGQAFVKIEPTMSGPWLTVRLVYGQQYTQLCRVDVEDLGSTIVVLLEEAEVMAGLYQPKTLEEVKPS